MAEMMKKDEQQDEIQIQILEQNSKGEVTKVNVPDEVIIGLPRVEHGCAGMYPRVMINGKKYTLGSHFYNEEERAARNAYYKVHRGNGDGGGSSSSVKVEEVNARLDKFMTWAQETLKDTPFLNAFEEQIQGLYFEDRKVTAVKNMLAGMSPAQMQALKAMLGM